MKLFSVPVVVAVTVFGFANFAAAADQPAAPAIAGPTMVEDFRGCATCNSAAAACDSCGKVKKHCHGCHKSCTPYVTTLCPGACFGYFQTQWHRWENVCPIPYQGVGLTDAPVRAAPPANVVVPPKTLGSDVPLPKNLPMVPMVPGK
ncbi:MAG: hypothetical protein U0791_18610 [Gemmataceae bacterium]